MSGACLVHVCCTYLDPSILYGRTSSLILILDPLKRALREPCSGFRERESKRKREREREREKGRERGREGEKY